MAGVNDPSTKRADPVAAGSALANERKWLPMTETDRNDLVQTVEQASAAVEAAGLKVYQARDGARVYDPARQGAYALLVGGYRDRAFAQRVEVKEGGGRTKCSGAFHSRLRAIVEGQRAAIMAAADGAQS